MRPSASTGTAQLVKSVSTSGRWCWEGSQSRLVGVLIGVCWRSPHWVRFIGILIFRGVSPVRRRGSSLRVTRSVLRGASRAVFGIKTNRIAFSGLSSARISGRLPLPLISAKTYARIRPHHTTGTIKRALL